MFVFFLLLKLHTALPQVLQKIFMQSCFRTRNAINQYFSELNYHTCIKYSITFSFCLTG